MGRFTILLLLAVSGHALDNANAPDAEHAPVLREVEPLVVAIPVRNPHDRAMKVKLLDPTCSCATLEIEPKFILPHEAATLRVAVVNKDRSGPQHVGVSVFLTDPDVDSIEVAVLWSVRACVQVDSIAPGQDPASRPADRGWHDIYRYPAKVRPDELERLKKRIRLSCPEGEVPAGGLKIDSIDYTGSLWRFVQVTQADGSVLITATARDPDKGIAEGEYTEAVTVHTNHPDKATIPLSFQVVVAKDAGARVVDPSTGK